MTGTGPLASQHCVECRSDSSPLSNHEIAELLRQVPDWKLVEREGMKRIERVFEFPDFAGALAFTNKVGALAEAEGHHPALLTEWGRLTVTWWTHSIAGLHGNDFVMAARTDRLA